MRFGSLKVVELPDTITKIGIAAFSQCEELEEIELPASLTTIETSAFGMCHKLKAITFPENVTFIGDEAFRYCPLIETVTIPEKVTSIGGYAFGSGALETIYWNAVNCTETGWIHNVGNSSYGIFASDAQGECTATKMYIGENVKLMPQNAFVSSLEDVYYAGTLAQWCGIEFESNPLYYANHLYINNEILTGEITLPDTVTKVPHLTFKNSTVTSVTIPDSVTEIGFRLFDGCATLETLSIPFVGATAAAATFNEGTFGYYFGIKSYEGSYQSFSRVNGSIYETYIPRTLTKVIVTGGTAIGDNAFEECRIAEIILADTITSIGESAFADCYSLTTITFNGTEAQWEAISKGTGWNYSTGNYTVHCTDGDIAKS